MLAFQRAIHHLREKKGRLGIELGGRWQKVKKHQKLTSSLVRELRVAKGYRKSVSIEMGAHE
jgi:hypothetical protein